MTSLQYVLHDIQALDLTEFRLQSLPLDDCTELLFTPTLVLTPELLDDKQYMTIQYPEMGIDVIAQTRDELWEELTAVIYHLWQFCAKEPDEKLGRVMQEQKRVLLHSIKEVPHDNT